MKRAKTTLLLPILTLLLLAGCTTNVREAAPGEDASVPLEEARDEVRKMANEALQDLYRIQPSAKRAVQGAAGYAVFSNFGMKILITGSASGKGMAVNNKDKREVFMRMAEFQAGLGFGVKKYRLVWVFENQAAFDNFVNNGYEFGGEAALTAQASGEGVDMAGAASISPGVWVYQITDNGIAAELTVKGAKYYRDKGID